MKIIKQIGYFENMISEISMLKKKATSAYNITKWEKYKYDSTLVNHKMFTGQIPEYFP